MRYFGDIGVNDVVSGEPVLPVQVSRKRLVLQRSRSFGANEINRGPEGNESHRPEINEDNAVDEGRPIFPRVAVGEDF